MELSNSFLQMGFRDLFFDREITALLLWLFANKYIMIHDFLGFKIPQKQQYLYGFLEDRQHFVICFHGGKVKKRLAS